MTASLKTKRYKTTRDAGLRMLIVVAGVLFGSSIVQAQPLDARALLKSMSDYVSSQQNIALTFDTDIDVITPQLEKIQFASSGEVLIARPDKLRAHRRSGHADVSLYFDGKTASVVDKRRNAYTQFEVPGPLDHLIEALRSGHGVALPAADLLLADPYTALAAGVLEAKHIGRGIIDGIECEHLAFRNFDTDWQLWVEVGSKPIPRKMVIVSKTVNSAPQYTIRIKSWKTDLKADAAAFAFKPPADATQLDPAALIDLDELPQGTPTGEAQ